MVVKEESQERLRQYEGLHKVFYSNSPVRS